MLMLCIIFIRAQVLEPDLDMNPDSTTQNIR